MSCFPLRKLPDRASLLVVRHMEMIDQFAYSFCSKNTKKAVKSLNLKASKIEMDFGIKTIINVHINDNLSFKSVTSFCWLTDVPVIMSNGDWRMWKFSDFLLKNWLQHICEVFHHPILDELSFENSDFYYGTLAIVRDAAKGVRVGTLSVPHARDVFRNEAMKIFPCYEELLVTSLPDQEVDKIFIQNLKRVDVSSSQNITIDQVLHSNCELITLDSSALKGKELNKLLKLWMRGSNPRLKQLHVSGTLSANGDRPIKELVLKGIKHTHIPRDSQEVHRRKMSGGLQKVRRLAGGFIIRRFDGNDAVVLLRWGTFDLITDCVLSH